MQHAKIRASKTSAGHKGAIAAGFRAPAPRRRSSTGTAVAAAASSPSPALDADDTPDLRATLAGGWPNALQLPATAPHRPAIPCLTTARHYVNLTAGAEALPLLLRSGLGGGGAAAGAAAPPPPRFTRITSTACEQQALVSTLSEVADASLLMDLALGETVIIWDAGSRRRRRRNKKAGRQGDDDEGDDPDADDACCPRALWYGTEFARWALHTLWFDQEPSSPSPPARAYLRGFNVRKEFERHLKAAPAPLLKRLRYFARYIPQERRLAATSGVSGQVGAVGTGPFALRLYGMYKGTDHDAEPGWFVERVREGMAAAGAAGAAAGAAAAGGRPQQQPHDEAAARKTVLEAGWRVFAGGVGHEEMGGLLRKS